jgi:hypothetical protein
MHPSNKNFCPTFIFNIQNLDGNEFFLERERERERDLNLASRARAHARTTRIITLYMLLSSFVASGLLYSCEEPNNDEPTVVTPTKPTEPTIPTDSIPENPVVKDDTLYLNLGSVRDFRAMRDSVEKREGKGFVIGQVSKNIGLSKDIDAETNAIYAMTRPGQKSAKVIWPNEFGLMPANKDTINFRYSILSEIGNHPVYTNPEFLDAEGFPWAFFVKLPDVAKFPAGSVNTLYEFNVSNISQLRVTADTVATFTKGDHKYLRVNIVGNIGLESESDMDVLISVLTMRKAATVFNWNGKSIYAAKPEITLSFEKWAAAGKPAIGLGAGGFKFVVKDPALFGEYAQMVMVEGSGGNGEYDFNGFIPIEKFLGQMQAEIAAGKTVRANLSESAMVSNAKNGVMNDFIKALDDPKVVVSGTISFVANDDSVHFVKENLDILQKLGLKISGNSADKSFFIQGITMDNVPLLKQVIANGAKVRFNEDYDFAITKEDVGFANTFYLTQDVKGNDITKYLAKLPVRSKELLAKSGGYKLNIVGEPIINSIGENDLARIDSEVVGNTPAFPNKDIKVVGDMNFEEIVVSQLDAGNKFGVLRYMADGENRNLGKGKLPPLVLFKPGTANPAKIDFNGDEDDRIMVNGHNLTAVSLRSFCFPGSYRWSEDKKYFMNGSLHMASYYVVVPDSLMPSQGQILPVEIWGGRCRKYGNDDLWLQFR